MKLKKLVLQGYKTFATKTEFLFDGGITAIVGPNGSGKSNVADAVRWVLGEQSYRTLRGKRTVDMIFAGSQSRPRAGMAQAILTLDNSDGWLPVDYTEVEIGRRAFRSGENEYILNGQKVRLKDISDLLASSGLAQRTYTIIGQGLVDQALSLKAEERRALFEEAAGINHYKSRRAETLRRLQETQRNLQRVHDILAEIQPRLRSLKRQATRAKNHEQINADLHHLLQIWYGYRWERGKGKLREARITAVSSEKNWKTSHVKLRVQQENMNDLRRRINKVQQQVADTQDQRDTLRDKLETSRREVAILQERRQSIARQLGDLETEFPSLHLQQQQAQLGMNEAVAELISAQENLSTNQSQLMQFNVDFQTQQTAINEAQQTLQQANKQRQASQTRLAQAEGQFTQLQERLQEEMPPPFIKGQLSTKGQAVSATANLDELVKIEAEVVRLTAVQTQTQVIVKENRDKRHSLREEKRTLISNLKQLRRILRNEEKQLNQQRNQLARMETRAEMLDQMRLKDGSIGNKKGLLGNLASFITIPAAYQTAVEAALKNRLSLLIFEDEEALWEAVGGKLDAAITAVSLENLTPPAPLHLPSGAIGWVNSLISTESEMANVVQLLLGNTLLVNDVQSAYQLAAQLPHGSQVVTLDGFVAHAGGLVETSSRGKENSTLAREKAWRTALNELDVQKKVLAKAETAVSSQQTIIQKKQTEIDALQQEENQATRTEREENETLSKTQRQLDRVKQQQQFIIRQQEAKAKVAARLRARVQEVEQQITAYREQGMAAETAVMAAESQLATLPVAAAQQQRETLQQAIQTTQTIVAGRQAVVDSRRTTLNQVDGQLARLKQRQAHFQQQQTLINQSEVEDQRIQFQDQLNSLDAKLMPLKERLTEHRKEMMGLEEETAVTQKITHNLETIYAQTKIKFTQEKSEIESLQERIKADLGIVALSYDDDQTGPTPLPIGGVKPLPQVQELPDDIEETIQTYRAQMQRMGAINPDAPAEFEETQTRFDFMNQQIDDLTQTEAKLREIIAELDDLTSRAFAETVERVNDVFGPTFTQLFGGGAARLLLTDPDDLTVSGVDIIARLPNRREQGLGLLSGGERSLTAAALIFSLLKVSPTPFCVMDEVDAALDEANINRFRELLRELSLKTQFIVITHNRGTVQAAQTIYGISMGTDSTSQAISIKPEDYVKQPELV